MTDREKVIKQLEICKAAYHTHKCPQDCPLLNVDDCYFINMSAALELLREQEPRVLTLDDVKNAEIVWIEQVGQCVPAIKIRTLEDGKMMFVYSSENNICTINIMPKYYNSISRCWSSHPTDEQREAVKWDG